MTVTTKRVMRNSYRTKLSRASLIAAVVVQVCCSSALAQPSAKEGVIFPEQRAVLSTDEIARFKEQAMAGSAEAAHRLATHFALIRLDFRSEIYWQQVRVENGDRDARYDLGFALANDSDPLNRIRGRYWLEQVIRDGPPRLVELARDALDDLNDQNKMSKPNKR
jgi:hypothetical protein